MKDVSSLPDAIVESIIRLARARARCIPGTNKYARVCKQWRKASSSSSSSSADDPEDLQLFMNLDHMSDEEVGLATDWMAMYGQAVTTLVMGASMGQAQQLQRLLSSAPALTRLKRLEVEQDNSLFMMAPVLGQLPQLQRLAAHVSLGIPCGVGLWETAYNMPNPGLYAGYEEVYPGKFLQTDPAQNMLPLEQLCPKVTQLSLTLHATRSHLVVDGSLPALLPAGLRQLSLGAAPGTERMRLYSSSLVHLSALQRLFLHDVLVAGQDEGDVAQDLGALKQLQQLHLSTSDECVVDEDDLLQLAPKVISCGLCAWGFGGVDSLPPLVNLRQLALYDCDANGGVPVGTDEILADLTRLQELILVCSSDDSLVPVLEQVAGMSTLRSLQLRGTLDGEAPLAPRLALCTQLTSLVIAGVTEPAMGSCMAALQQLTALRCLTMPAELLLQQGGTWLAQLTSLTRLGVKLGHTDEGTGAGAVRAHVQSLLEQVQAWPLGLQQVLVAPPQADGNGMHGFKPECWQFTPPVVGGAQFTVWLEVDTGSASGWVRPFRPCPHLPGVWELQGEVEGQGG